jgi:hypothetical protein
MSEYLDIPDTPTDYTLVDYDVSFDMDIHDIRTRIRVTADINKMSVEVDGQPVVTRYDDFRTPAHVCPKRKWSDLWRRR